MEKKRHILVLIEALIIVAVFTFIFLYHTPSFTGFTIYTSQPGSEGNDTYLREDSGTNYGTTTTMKIGTTAGGVDFRPLIKFDVSSVDPTKTVTSGIVELYVEISSGANFTMKAYRVTSHWNETAANWTSNESTNSWTTIGGDYSTTESGSITLGNATGWHNISITSLVQNWANTSFTNYGLILITTDAENGDIREFSTSDSATPAQRPRIYIDYTDNALPIITNITSDANSTTNIKQVGEQVTFTTSWTDLENDNTQTYVCNSSNISLASGCGEGTFCNTSLGSTNPTTCSYTITANENKTARYWVAVCDDTNCSTTNQSAFYMNHAPVISITQPNGGETVNQSQGNYSIQFNVSDSDSDLLTGNLYYGTTQNSTTNTIATNINLTNFCTDPDSNTATANNCTYTWNSTGLYGTYFLTSTINDTSIFSNDSSDSSFNIRSIVDNVAPSITAQWISDTNIYSGKSTIIYANITEENIKTTWVEFNYTTSNRTMSNTTATQFNTTFTATSVGTYKFRVYANDTLSNTNNTMEWVEFTVTKPNATHQNHSAPSTALPDHTIRITAQLNATNPLKGVYSQLNTPTGFTFLSGYNQNTSLGNFTANQTKTATWHLSTPSGQSTYSLNITYHDKYTNSWNSSNFNIQVTSAVGGGYSVEVSGYPEVETGDPYYAEAYFKQAGISATPDSITTSIYDATGSLTVGPAAMDTKSTGTYNYTYTVGASATEGQWETRVNATLSSISYYHSEFWKVVGGPFDVRTITVEDSTIQNLNISVVTENTGGANKDLSLTWNLTKTDTDAILDSGADTFMVPASSTRTWYVQPSTTYVGQVQITFLGFYSGTEKAGAYKVFTTTSNATTPETPSPGGGGGGGGATITTENLTTSLKIISDAEITIPKNSEKIIYLTIENTGTTTLNNITLKIENLEDKYYTLSPKTITSISPGKTEQFAITFLITNLSGEIQTNYNITSNELSSSKPVTIKILSQRDYFLEQINKLTNKISNLKDSGTDTKECEEIIKSLQLNIEKEEFINAEANLQLAENCISNLEKEAEKPAPKKMESYWMWIITWILILLLIIIIAILAYIIYKKFGLMDYLRKKQTPTAPIPKTKNQAKNKKLENLKEKLET